MGINVIVTRGIDRTFMPTGQDIALSEWIDLVGGDETLRINTEPHVGLHPHTGERFAMRPRRGDAEILLEGRWEPFLYFQSGVLSMRYSEGLDDPQNPVRKKIAAVAKQLGALVALDSNDYLFEW